MPATAAQQTSLANLYLALFDRAPDAAGFEFWSQALANGASLASITASFIASPEARTIYPAAQTAEQFVSSFYQAVFGRAVDASGLAFWSGVLNAAGGPGSDAARADLVARIVAIVSTPLASKPADLTDAQYAQTVADRDLFAKKVVAGLDFAINLKSNDLTLARQLIAALETPVTPEPPVPQPPIPGKTFLLTTGANTFVGDGGDDIFDGRYTSGNQQLQTADRLDGGAGTDTLYATIALSSAQPQLSSIENLVLDSINASAVLDLRDATGLAKVEFAGSTANGRVDFVGNAALSVVGQTADARFLASTATNLSLTLKNVGAAGTPVLVSVHNSLSLADVASITHTIATTDAHVSWQVLGDVPVRTVNVAASGANTLRFMGAGADTIQTIAVTGTGFADFSGSANNSARSLVGLTRLTAGDGGVRATIDQVAAGSVTVETGAGADTIVMDAASVASLRVGAGNDLVTLRPGTFATGAAVDLGDGDDLLIVSAGLAGTSVTVAGGAGRDTLRFDTATVTGLDKVTGFEVMALAASGATVDVVDAGSIDAFAIVNSGTTTFTNARSTSTFTIDNSNGTSAVSIAHAAGQTATDVTVNNANALAGSKTLGQLALAGATAVSLTSSGTGTNSNVITTLTNADNSVITVKGSADLSITNALAASAAGSKVDAAAFTGKLTVTGSGKSDTLIGGAGNDVIDGGVVSGSADTLTGRGGANSFVFSTPDVDTAVSAVTAVITDFKPGVDKIQVTAGAAGAGGTAASIVRTGGSYFSLGGMLADADAQLTGGKKYFLANVNWEAYIVTDGDGAGYTNVIKLAGVPLASLNNTDLIATLP
jgi:hypothetical protein